jgi:hypothetical protein
MSIQLNLQVRYLLDNYRFKDRYGTSKELVLCFKHATQAGMLCFDISVEVDDFDSDNDFRSTDCVACYSDFNLDELLERIDSEELLEASEAKKFNERWNSKRSGIEDGKWAEALNKVTFVSKAAIPTMQSISWSDPRSRNDEAAERIRDLMSGDSD